MRGMKQNHLMEDVKVTEFLRYEKTLERRVGPHVNIGGDVVRVLLQSWVRVRGIPTRGRCMAHQLVATAECSDDGEVRW